MEIGRVDLSRSVDGTFDVVIILDRRKGGAVGFRQVTRRKPGGSGGFVTESESQRRGVVAVCIQNETL